jgi:hypothetical protein
MFRPSYNLINASNKFKYNLCLNLNATNYIEDYINIIDTNNEDDLKNITTLLSYKDECVIKLIIKKYMEKHEFISNNMLRSILKNSNAINIIQSYNDKISKMNCFCCLCMNENPDVIPIIKKLHYKFKRCCLDVLCKNPNAISIINTSQILAKISKNNSWILLCTNKNPDVIPIFEKHINNLDQHCWRELCKNPSPPFVSFIEKHLDKIEKYYCWSKLCLNPSAIHIIKDKLDIIKTPYFDVNYYPILCNLCSNPNALEFIEQNQNILDIIAIKNLCCLRNSHAMKIVKRNINKLNYECWIIIWKNPFALEIIEEYLNLLDEYSGWHYLCENSNPKVISIIERNLDKIKNEKCFDALGLNENAFHLYYLFLKYDYKAMTNKIKELNKELNDYVFHPTRLSNMSKQYNISFIQYLSILEGTECSNVWNDFIYEFAK